MIFGAQVSVREKRPIAIWTEQCGYFIRIMGKFKAPIQKQQKDRDYGQAHSYFASQRFPPARREGVPTAGPGSGGKDSKPGHQEQVKTIFRKDEHVWQEIRKKQKI